MEFSREELALIQTALLARVHKLEEPLPSYPNMARVQIGREHAAKQSRQLWDRICTHLGRD